MAISRKWMQRFTMMLMAIFFVSNLFAAQPVLLTGMRIQPSPNKTRFIFMLNKKPRGRVQYFLRPYRVVVELSNTQKNFTIQNAKLLGANVTSIHTESTKGLLRFIFNTTGKVNFKINFLSVNGKIEMQLDIISEAVLPKKIATFNHDDILQEFSKKINQAVLKKQIKSQFIQKPHIFTIVIDPGHGGRGLEYSGISCFMLMILLPAMMVWRGRYHQNLATGYQVRGGKFLLAGLILFASSMIILGLKGAI